MTITEARKKLSALINKGKKVESDSDRTSLGYFIAPTDKTKFYEFLRSFWELDSPSMIELFKNNGDLQKTIEEEDVDVFYFRGSSWKKLREWHEENDKESYAVYDIPYEVCED